jgi:hypothetical protein
VVTANLLLLLQPSPHNVPAIILKKDNRTIRKLSLNDLAKLPVDEEGYHLVKVE